MARLHYLKAFLPAAHGSMDNKSPHKINEESRMVEAMEENRERGSMQKFLPNNKTMVKTIHFHKLSTYVYINSYLYKFKILANPTCSYNEGQISEHLIFNCNFLTNERRIPQIHHSLWRKLVIILSQSSNRIVKSILQIREINRPVNVIRVRLSVNMYLHSTVRYNHITRCHLDSPINSFCSLDTVLLTSIQFSLFPSSSSFPCGSYSKSLLCIHMLYLF